MKSSSCSQEYLGNVCVAYSVFLMHACTLGPKFHYSCAPSWPDVRQPGSQGCVTNRAGPERTLPLIKVYKIGLNAAVACELSKLCGGQLMLTAAWSVLGAQERKSIR